MRLTIPRFSLLCGCALTVLEIRVRETIALMSCIVSGKFEELGEEDELELEASVDEWVFS